MPPSLRMRDDGRGAVAKGSLANKISISTEIRHLTSFIPLELAVKSATVLGKGDTASCKPRAHVGRAVAEIDPRQPREWNLSLCQ